MKINISDHEIVCYTPQDCKQDTIAARHAKKPEPVIHNISVIKLNKTKTLNKVFDHYQDSMKWT